MNRTIAEISLRGEHEISQAERFVEEVCDYYHVGNEYFANVMLGTMEAVRLVLKRRPETGRVITIQAVKHHTGLKFNIRGNPCGGGPAESPDPLDQAIAEEKLSRELFIIKSLADELRISEGGCMISLRFNITNYDSERSLGRVGHLKAYFERRKVIIDKDNA